MSHFNVIVITDEKPSKDRLAEIMQPWHEYECTGTEDRYVVDVDVTDEVAEQFNEEQEVVVLADGKVLSRYDTQALYTGPKKHDCESCGTFVLPTGAVEKTMPADEARKHGIGYATMADAAKEYFGIEAVGTDGKFYRRTNPNRKWDWWTVGGRWTGMLMPHYEPEKDPDNIETCSICQGTGRRDDDLGRSARAADPAYTCNGCAGTGKEVKWPTKWRKIAGDQMRLGDVPLEELRTLAEVTAVKNWDKAQRIIAGRKVPVWDEVREAHAGDIEAARKAYNDDPVMADLATARMGPFFGDLSAYATTRESVAASARVSAGCPFAIVKDGQWYEKGEMIWWGMVRDEKGGDEWAEQYARLLGDLPPTTWLTVIDCHI